jgi:hypothetical protein
MLAIIAEQAESLEDLRHEIAALKERATRSASAMSKYQVLHLSLHLHACVHVKYVCVPLSVCISSFNQ